MGDREGMGTLKRNRRCIAAIHREKCNIDEERWKENRVKKEKDRLRRIDFGSKER